MSDIAEKAATYQTLGHLEMPLNLSGEKFIKHKFQQQVREGYPETTFELFWE